MPEVVLKDHYVVLGADRSATSEELKKLYRKLVRETHPDSLGPDASQEAIDEASNLFKEVRLAHEQLSDPETRKSIDFWLAGQTNEPIASSEEFKGFDESCWRSTYGKPSIFQMPATTRCRVFGAGLSSAT